MWKGYESQKCTRAVQRGVLRALLSDITNAIPPQQLVITFDNRFSSSGRLSGTGRSLKLLPPSVLQPAGRAKPNIYVCCSVLWTLPPSTGRGGGPQLSSNVV
jgi:hypothetical protein